MGKKQRRLSISIIVILVLVIVFCIQNAFFVSNCGKIKATASRTHQTLSNFEPIWILDDVYVHKTQNVVNLVANSGKLIMYGTLGRCGNNNLVRFSTVDGEIISESASGHSVPTNTGVHHIAYNPTHIYLGYDGSRSTPSNVIAYNIDTNVIDWIRPIPINSGSQIGSLTASETIVGVGTTRYFLLDAFTGEIVRERNEDSPEFPLSSFGNFAFWYAAVDPQSSLSSLEFWANITPEIYQPPLLLNDSVVFRTAQAGRTFGKVRVFDRKTNELLWETSENVISNVAIDHTRAYYLTSTPELVAVDIRTGHVVGKIEFTSENLEPQDERGFYVAASDSNVFVYFGDSRRLLASHFLPNE